MSKDIRIGMNGVRLAAAEGYRICTEVGSTTVHACGQTAPVAVLRDPPKYTVTLRRLRLREEVTLPQEEFTMTIRRPGGSLCFTGCLWTTAREEAEADGRLWEALTLTAASCTQEAQ